MSRTQQCLGSRRAVRVALLAAVMFALFAAATVVVGVRAAGATDPVPVDVAVRQAVAYAEAAGVSAGVAVLDEATGTVYRAGDSDQYYGSASVMKVFVAARLLASGKLSDPERRRLAWNMITRSDDDALEQLLPMVGGTAVIDWVRARYHLPRLGRRSPKPGCWGNTQVSAEGIVALYRALAGDAVVAPWLFRALAHHTRRAADGTRQDFGIADAVPGRRSAVKQGWGSCSSNSGGSVINSTGVVGSGRFAIAILTDTGRGTVNGHAFNRFQANVVTHVAHLLLPGGTVLLPDRGPLGRLTGVAAAAHGGVRVAGWAYDPDRPDRSLEVTITRDGRLVATVLAQRPARLRSHGHLVPGAHGFAVRLGAQPAGQHRYCARAHNLGPPQADRPLGCRTVDVTTEAPTGS
jgi:hypothetical protein